jgi:hypothetical protein
MAEPLTVPLLSGQLPFSVRPSGDGLDVIDGPAFELPPLPGGQTEKSVSEEMPTRAGILTGPAAALREAVAETSGNLSVEDQAFEDDLREAFSEFLETKQRLGESMEGVTFERFATKLRANRAPLLERYGCKKIRFQVYVKDGKAAIKAAPVRE